MKRLGYFLSAICLLFTWGCIPPIIDLSEFLPDQTEDEQKQVEKYEGKVYLIGSLTGTLKEEFEAAMTFSEFPDGATDGAVVISSDMFGSLTQAQLDSIGAAFTAHQPLILVQATGEQITDFIQQFLGETFMYTLPNGVEYAEIYAIDLEEGDHIWQWAMYPPDLTDDEDTVAEQQDRLGYLVDWMQENSQRIAAVTAETVENAKAAAGLVDNGNDLIKLASAFVNTSNFRRAGVDYQLTHFVYSCHSYVTGHDWFYIEQKCVFNAGGAWEGKKTDFWGSNAWWYSERVQWYIDNIDIDATMLGFDYNSEDVAMIQSSPETTNNEQSVTSGVDFTIGGDVGISKSGPSATVSSGITISNSKTVNIRDCNVTNKSNDRSNNAHWFYQFNRCSAIPYFLYAGVTDPPSLATSTFQPINQWIWRVTPKLRQNNIPVHVRVNIDLCSSAGILIYYWIANIKHTTTNAGVWEYNMYIPYPPDNTN